MTLKSLAAKAGRTMLMVVIKTRIKTENLLIIKPLNYNVLQAYIMYLKSCFFH